MAANRLALVLVSALLVAAQASLAAQGKGTNETAGAAPAAQATTEKPNETDDTSSVGYSFETDDKGNVTFTQTLSWDPDEYALKFEVTVKNVDDTIVIHEFTENASITMRLAPGNYTYDITKWNLLDQKESESGWQPISVIKAEIPHLGETSPAFIYMDSLEGKVTLSGSNLLEGARVFLRNSSGHQDEGKETGRKGDTEVTVTFPDRAYQPGTFDIVIVDPGGIPAVAKQALHILYQRPVDILFSAGYSPLIFLQDDWFKENWSESAYWLSANGNLSVFFLKQKWGFLGAEAAVSVFRLTGGVSGATITSDYLLVGGNLAYKYRLTRSLHALARAGGGIAMSDHSFDYKGTAGQSMTTKNLYLDGGLSLQYFLPLKFFAEVGADWIELFESGHYVGGVRPTVKIGYQIF